MAFLGCETSIILCNTFLGRNAAVIISNVPKNNVLCHKHLTLPRDISSACLHWEVVVFNFHQLIFKMEYTFSFFVKFGFWQIRHQHLLKIGQSGSLVCTKGNTGNVIVVVKINKLFVLESWKEHVRYMWQIFDWKNSWQNVLNALFSITIFSKIWKGWVNPHCGLKLGI